MYYYLDFMLISYADGTRNKNQTMHSYGEGRDKSCDYSNFFGVNMIHRNHILYFSDNFVTTITNI